MEEFILCKLASGNVMEVDIDEDGSVSLDTLKSQFGPQVTTLTYTNELTGRERLVRVSGNSLLKPKDGWKTTTRVYTVSCGITSTTESPGEFTPRRTLISHPMIIKREPAAAETIQVASVKPEIEDQAAKCTELTKKQLLSRMKDSPIARTAVYQWNNSCTDSCPQNNFPWIRWHAKMPEGTTKEEALLNQQLRETISNDGSVKSHFSTFYLEDGSGKVVLDVIKAYEHVRHVLNDMRWTQKPSNSESGQDEKENCDDTVQGEDDLTVTEPSDDYGYKTSRASSIRVLRNSQNNTRGLARGRKRSGTASNPKRTTAPSKKKANSTSAASRILKISQDLQSDENNIEEIEETEVRVTDERSEYERSNDAKRHANKAFLHQHVLGGKPKLQIGDAVLFARAWFNVGEKLTVGKIVEECDDLGLAPPEKQMKLRAALAHLGNELVDNQLVNLKRPAGITVQDIEFTISRSVDNN